MKTYIVGVHDKVARDMQVANITANSKTEALVKSGFIKLEDCLPVDVSYVTEDMIASLEFEELKFFLQDNADIHVEVVAVNN